MSFILTSSIQTITRTSPAANNKRNPIRSIGHYGRTVCMNAECSIDGSEAAVEMTVEQTEELVLELRAAIFAISGRRI